MPATRWPTRSWGTCRDMRWDATITKCCAMPCRDWPTTSSNASDPWVIACSSTPGPCSRRRWRATPGIGWIGKHTNLIARDAGSYFFIGEILTDLPLPVDEAASAHCGTCSACIPACPTGAITAPQQLDARRCISYLTIELHGAIPTELRRMMGNRIYGCDDCQLVCPWNKFARAAAHPDFKTRHKLDASRLSELFAWTEAEFLERTEGSAIRRIGYERWLRNIAVALGNAPATSANQAALAARARRSFGAGARTRGVGAGRTRSPPRRLRDLNFRASRSRRGLPPAARSSSRTTFSRSLHCASDLAGIRTKRRKTVRREARGRLPRSHRDDSARR